jgi:phosphate transport system substrate-binding protein
MNKLLLYSLLCVLVSCSTEKETPQQKVITITGSESEKPLAVLLSAEYQKQHPDIQFNILGGGTDAGISALLKGETALANASRLANEGEHNACTALGLQLNQLIIAQDVIAVITHPSVGVEYISMQDLAGIYNGTIRNWSALGGADMAIYPVGRKHGSGTRSYMQHRLALESFCKQTLEFETYEDIVSAVRTTPGSIGYVSRRFIQYDNGSIHPDVWVMNISLNGMPYASPLDKEAIAYGDYPLLRPLFQYFTTVTPEQKAFLEYETSDEGQAAIEKSGYIPLSADQKNINLKKTKNLSGDSVVKTLK